MAMADGMQALQTEVERRRSHLDELNARVKNLEQAIEDTDEEKRQVYAAELDQAREEAQTVETEVREFMKQIEEAMSGNSTPVDENAVQPGADESGKPGDEPDPQDNSAEADSAALAAAAGEFVSVPKLVELKQPGGDNAFSTSVRQLLGIAIGTVPTTDDRVAVDLVGILAAMLRKTEGMQPNGSTEHTFREWLVGQQVNPDTSLVYAAANISDGEAPELLAAPDAMRIFADAHALVTATHTRPREPVAMRHVLAAIMLSEEGRRALRRFNLVSESPTYFRDFATAFRDHISKRFDSEDRLDAWDETLAPLRRLLHTGGTRHHRPAYDADTFGGLSDDRMNVAKDAQSLAELACLRTSEPPLAIGLFGDWGSGKSTFMKMLREAIDKVCESDAAKVWEEDPETTGQKLPPPFVSNVAHVWFNAWHYSDANLWASLVTHLFDELQKQASNADEGSPAWLGKTQFSALANRLSIVKEEAEETTTRITAVATDIEETEDQIKEVEQARADEEAALEQKRLDATLAAIPVNSGTITAAMKALGADKVSVNGEELQMFMKEADSLAGTVKSLFASFRGFRGRPLLYLGFGLLAYGVIVLGGVELLSGWLQGTPLGNPAKNLTENFLQAVGGVGGLVAWLAPHLGFIREKLEPLRRAQAGVEAEWAKRRRKLDEAEADMRRKLADLQAESSGLLQQLQELNDEKRELETMDKGEAPAKLIRHFLQSRTESRRYRDGLGLISHIHRDFQLMSDLMGEERAKREKRGRKGMAPEQLNPELPQLDRIVLYIDDLDRCRADKVVEVLEAIHLLLALDLFVVVVGVDARWLHSSLLTAYEHQLDIGDAKEGRATPGDYLEKIFQIPFWLTPLDFDQGGTYRTLIDGIIGEDVIDTRGTTTPPPPPPPTPSDDDVVGLEIVNATLAPRPSEETMVETVERVTFTDVEVDLIEALGPLAGKSPRAVKRMINLYRLIRVGYRGAALDVFLNGPDGVMYPEVLFWLAMEAGCPRPALAVFIEALEKHPDMDMIELSRELNAPNPSFESPASELIRRAAGDVRKTIARAIRATGSARSDTVTAKNLRDAYPIAMRFSFQQEYSRSLAGA